MEEKAKLNYQRNSYTIADFYMSYRDYITKDTAYDVPFTKFKEVVLDYFKYLRDQIMLESKEIKLPCRLGTIQIIKHQPKEFTGKSLRIDYKSSKEEGKVIYFLNEHSSGWKYRFYWSKKDCLVKNKIQYQFIATRANKRDLAAIIFSKQKDYPEM